MGKVNKIAGVAKDTFLGQYNKLLKRGLSCGIQEDNRVCIEAAVDICMHRPDVDIDNLGEEASDGRFGDGPKCVKDFIRGLKITLNDCEWSSDEYRAAGLWAVGIAQLGSNQLKLTKAQWKKVLRIALKRIFLPVVMAQARKQYANIKKMPSTLEELAAFFVDNDCDLDAYQNIVDVLEDAVLLSPSDEHNAVFAAVSDLDFDADMLKMLYADAITAALIEVKSPGAKWLKVIPVPPWVKKARKAVGLK